ncbi:MAG: hypothetical protein EOO43_15650 [Flavobacterium sp.]|nr:MAG: hypothetical protein EOO43_15650 [Flavobacterium sp.]
MVIDIEHVLPKSLFGDFMFKLFNLNVSCKRCNMQIKKNRVDFIRDVATILQNPEDAQQYLFLHPNLDSYYDHMDYFVTIRNAAKSVKYIPLKEKGRYTYEFFQLEKLEIETLNIAQGIIEEEESGLVLQIPTDLVAESKELIEQL